MLDAGLKERTGREMRTWAVIGTGAVGGYYGARLAQAGFTVHFLLHSDYAYVKQHGLTVESPDGSFTLNPVSACNDARSMPRCDVALVALKATRNDLLPEILPHAVKPGGTIVLLQNGLGVEEDIAAIRPDAAIIGGLCFICSTKTGPGRIHHQDYGMVRMAQYTPGGVPAGITGTLAAVAGNFTAAGIEALPLPDLQTARWEKLVWNVPFNGLSVVLNADTGRLVHDPALRPLIEELMSDVLRGASARGSTISPAIIRRMIELTEAMRPYYPSMKVDFDSGREMEVEAMYGAPHRAAAKSGVRLAAIECLYRELQFLQGQARA